MEFFKRFFLFFSVMAFACSTGTGDTKIVGPTGVGAEGTAQLSIRVYDRDSFEDEASFIAVNNAQVTLRYSDVNGDHVDSKTSSRDETIFVVPVNLPIEMRVGAVGFDPYLEMLRLDRDYIKEVGIKRNVNAIDPDSLVITVVIDNVNVTPDALIINADNVEFNVENVSIVSPTAIQLQGSIQIGDFILNDPTINTNGTIQIDPQGNVIVEGDDMTVSASGGVNLTTGDVILEDMDVSVVGQTELEIDSVNCTFGCITTAGLSVDANGVVIVCDSSIGVCP